MELVVRRYDAPCGTLLLGSAGDRLCLCDWMHDGSPSRTSARIFRNLKTVLTAGVSPATDRAAAQLDAYFAGRLRAFDVPMLFIGTPFQKVVWEALTSVAFGDTVSYASVARRIGRPEAVRAVANAIGANPLSIIVPCHRVVGSDGSLTGYAGGLEAKRMLLGFERSLCQDCCRRDR